MKASFDIRNSAFGTSPTRRLVIRGIEVDIGKEHAATFRHVQHPDLRADTATRASAKPKPRSHSAGLLRSERQLLANPPFNDSDWFRRDDDVRWQFGVPPKGNANFAWVQHFIHHLAPQTALRDSAIFQRGAIPQVVSEAKDNMAGFVLANGSVSSNQSFEGDIRRALIEADLVDCMVALPGQLFYGSSGDRTSIVRSPVHHGGLHRPPSGVDRAGGGSQEPTLVRMRGDGRQRWDRPGSPGIADRPDPRPARHRAGSQCGVGEYRMWLFGFGE